MHEKGKAKHQTKYINDKGQVKDTVEGFLIDRPARINLLQRHVNCTCLLQIMTQSLLETSLEYDPRGVFPEKFGGGV